jgi:hypothetical protein
MQRTHVLLACTLLLVAAGIVAGLVALAMASEEDVTPPVITSVSAYVSPRYVLITWRTDEPAAGRVNYSSERPGIVLVVGEVNLPALVTSHSVSLGPLQPETTYTYRVASADAVGNEAVSDEYTFTTLPLP